MEIEGLDFQKKVRQGYLEIAKNNRRIKILDCSFKSIEHIHLEVIDVFTKYKISL